MSASTSLTTSLTSTPTSPTLPWVTIVMPPRCIASVLTKIVAYSSFCEKSRHVFNVNILEAALNLSPISQLPNQPRNIDEHRRVRQEKKKDEHRTKGTQKYKVPGKLETHVLMVVWNLSEDTETSKYTRSHWYFE